jgi:hypothetical protein
MEDKTGREIHVSDWVDVFISDIVTAFVASIEEGGLAGPNGQIQPAMLILQIHIPMKMNPGQRAPCYLVRQGESKEEKQVVM